jgi:nitrogen fixation protein FixH
MRAARLWPLAVVVVLAVTVGANAVVFWLAGDRDAAVVEHDYYRRAVGWDSTMAQERRNVELGWRLQADLGALAPAGAPLCVRLADRAGAPLAGAAIRVEALHNRDAAHPVTARLAPTADGGYAARLPLRRPGMWELRFTVTRGRDRFTRALRREATVATAAAGAGGGGEPRP